MAYNTPAHIEWKRALIAIIAQHIPSTKEGPKRTDLTRIQQMVLSHLDVESTYEFMKAEILDKPRRLHLLDDTAAILDLDQHLRTFPKDLSRSPPRRAPSPPSAIQSGAQAAAQMTSPIHIDTKVDPKVNTTK